MAKIKFVLVDFAYDESKDGGIQKLKKKNQTNKSENFARICRENPTDWLCRPQNYL